MSKFGDAFAAARKAGKKTFTFSGKSYHTRTKEDLNRKSAPGTVRPKAKPKTVAPTKSKRPRLKQDVGSGTRKKKADAPSAAPVKKTTNKPVSTPAKRATTSSPVKKANVGNVRAAPVKKPKSVAATKPRNAYRGIHQAMAQAEIQRKENAKKRAKKRAERRTAGSSARKSTR